MSSDVVARQRAHGEPTNEVMIHSTTVTWEMIQVATTKVCTRRAIGSAETHIRFSLTAKRVLEAREVREVLGKTAHGAQKHLTRKVQRRGSPEVQNVASVSREEAEGGVRDPHHECGLRTSLESYRSMY